MLNRIYHYTSVDTLEKILQTKAIRFNRLDCVDDVQECSVSSYAKYVFISCWTESEEENIPLWKMYTNDVTQGVRISLPRDMFKTYPVISSKYLKTQMTKDIIPEVVQEQADYFVVPVDFEMMKNMKISLGMLNMCAIQILLLETLPQKRLMVIIL